MWLKKTVRPSICGKAFGMPLACRRDPCGERGFQYDPQGCADVLLVERERVLAPRRPDLPSLDPMGRDERVQHDGYGEQAMG